MKKVPKCGSQIILCDVPIRFDTYKGCSHACKYCFTFRKYDIKKIKNDEGVGALKRFINGERSKQTNWCDWNIPLHWGGMSDPFQPIEKIKGRSLECLKLFAETQYPFIVSTKGKLIVEEPYLTLLSKCNCVIQLSMVSPLYDKLEMGAPKFSERLDMLKKLCETGKRVIVRCQPYMLEALTDVIKYIPTYKEYGVHGIIFEGMKFFQKKEGLVKCAGDFTYPYDIMKNHMEQIKAVAHNNGLKFYCGENRLREYGDSLSCCGFDGLEGFRGNTANLNHYLYDKKNFKYTKNMGEKFTGETFKTSCQNTDLTRLVQKMKYNELMDMTIKDKNKLKIYLNRE